MSVLTTCDVKGLYYRQSTLLTMGSSLLGFTDFLTITNSQIKYLAACFMEKMDLVELGIIKFIERVFFRGKSIVFDIQMYIL